MPVCHRHRLFGGRARRGSGGRGQIEGSGVSSKLLDTKLNRDQFRAHVSYGGNKLLLHNRLSEEKEVSFRGGQKTLVYRENQYQESTKNPFTGSRDISWDAVSVDRPGTENDTTFFNMRFSFVYDHLNDPRLRRC